MNKEKEYTNVEKDLEEIVEEYEEQEYDNLSTHNCSHCGARLTVQEWEEMEDECSECAWTNTSGIIDDNVDEELE